MNKFEQDKVIEIDLKVKLDMETQNASIIQTEIVIKDAESKARNILRYYDNKLKLIRDRLNAFTANNLIDDESVRRQYEQKRYDWEVQLSNVLDDYEQIKMILGI